MTKKVLKYLNKKAIKGKRTINVEIKGLASKQLWKNISYKSHSCSKFNKKIANEKVEEIFIY